MKKQIKKSDLNKHINYVIGTRKAEENAVPQKHWDEAVAPLLRDGYNAVMEKMGYKHLQNDLLSAKKGLADMLVAFPEAATHAYNARTLSNELSRYSDRALKGLLEGFYSSVKENYDEGSFRELEQLPAEFRLPVYAELETYEKLVDTAENTIAQLTTLRNEAQHVVKYAKSGKDGMEKLKTLGFPMDAFKESEETLPAVQKFSVDTCILANNCK